jgi:TATA-box binding protein (TBP) (component of TFIID and TFIIIB)
MNAHMPPRHCSAYANAPWQSSCDAGGDGGGELAAIARALGAAGSRDCDQAASAPAASPYATLFQKYSPLIDNFPELASRPHSAFHPLSANWPPDVTQRAQEDPLFNLFVSSARVTNCVCTGVLSTAPDLEVACRLLGGTLSQQNFPSCISKHICFISHGWHTKNNCKQPSLLYKTSRITLSLFGSGHFVTIGSTSLIDSRFLIYQVVTLLQQHMRTRIHVYNLAYRNIVLSLKAPREINLPRLAARDRCMHDYFPAIFPGVISYMPTSTSKLRGVAQFFQSGQCNITGGRSLAQAFAQIMWAWTCLAPVQHSRRLQMSSLSLRVAAGQGKGLSALVAIGPDRRTGTSECKSPQRLLYSKLASLVPVRGPGKDSPRAHRRAKETARSKSIMPQLKCILRHLTKSKSRYKKNRQCSGIADICFRKLKPAAVKDSTKLFRRQGRHQPQCLFLFPSYRHQKLGFQIPGGFYGPVDVFPPPRRSSKFLVFCRPWRQPAEILSVRYTVTQAKQLSELTCVVIGNMVVWGRLRCPQRAPTPDNLELRALATVYKYSPLFLRLDTPTHTKRHLSCKSAKRFSSCSICNAQHLYELIWDVIHSPRVPPGGTQVHHLSVRASEFASQCLQQQQQQQYTVRWDPQQGELDVTDADSEAVRDEILDAVLHDMGASGAQDAKSMKM